MHLFPRGDPGLIHKGKTISPRLTRRKNRAHKKAKKTQSKRDWVRYQRLKSTSQREIRLAREKYPQGVVCEDSKRFWSYIKHQKQDSNGVSPLKGPDGLLQSDASSKAEILNNQFHSVMGQNTPKRQQKSNRHKI